MRNSATRIRLVDQSSSIDISDILGNIPTKEVRQVIAVGPAGEAMEPWPGGRLSDLAYDRILEALFDRRVEAGAFVSQNDLVNLLGIPLAPLRDALRVLQAEGVLVIHPRSGIRFV